MLLEEHTTNQIIGAFFAVNRAFGFGFLESIYANALAIELGRRGLRVSREVPIEVFYLGVPVGTYRFDMLVNDSVLVEIKAARVVTEADDRQLLNYLRAARVEVGLLVHFGPKAQFKRLVYSRQ
jgi:GxxExxY protein